MNVDDAPPEQMPSVSGQGYHKSEHIEPFVRDTLEIKAQNLRYRPFLASGEVPYGSPSWKVVVSGFAVNLQGEGAQGQKEAIQKCIN